MSVIDIKFRNDTAYLYKHHGMTLAGFEDQISKFEYAKLYENYRCCKDEFGVEKEHFPAINFVFYNYIFTNDFAPAPSALIDYYFDTYKSFFLFCEDNNFIIYNGNRYDRSAVIGRILRTYPSLIRDFHFFLMLQESGKFEQVIYSCKDDINGKDITVKDNDHEYEISLLVDTNRSNFFKNIKNAFRHNYGNNEIQIRLNLKKAASCGDFFVYDESHLKQVEKIVRNGGE